MFSIAVFATALTWFTLQIVKNMTILRPPKAKMGEPSLTPDDEGRA
jgi:hypothetical protein